MREYNFDSLFEMLKYKRPHDSVTEHEFVNRFIDSIQGMEKDSFGNRYLTIGESPTTMWSCHVDTVHKSHGKQGIIYHKDCLIVERDPRDNLKEPLGADDAVGVWILLNMIHHGIHGLYIFHRGEEKGGLGSDYITSYTPELVKGINHAIAFDRAGDSDIITYQFGGRCCSDGFAYNLADRLNGRNISLIPCERGIFTDTANYTHLIPECTNISVGYYDEHTPNECVDLFHLTCLMDSILDANFDNLPVLKEVDELFVPTTQDKSWNKTTYKTYNKADTWLDDGDLWHLYRTAGPELLVQMLLDIGCTEQDADNAWDRIDDLYRDYDRYNTKTYGG